jgi:hypothetical protein
MSDIRGMPLALMMNCRTRTATAMRNLALGTLVLFAFVPPAGAQTVLYSETFEGAHGWTLNNATGVNGADNNFWIVNDDEGGVTPPGCGVSTNGNKTLYVTSVFCPSCGADYDAGGLCGILFCPQANRRAESPAFSTLGQSEVWLSFDYISNGDGLTDNASVQYNVGMGWVTLTSSIKSAVCGSGKGQWTHFGMQLPAQAVNQPSLQIGFNWTNNDDGVGTNPSVAVNNVRVFVPSPLIFDSGFE